MNFLSFLECTQETYNGNNGTIDFPGEGKNYNNSLNCLFKINVAEDHFVQFSFSRFDFELAEDGKKCYDWLKFIDGIDESDNTTIFCNNGPDPLNKIFSSKNNEITLWMYSDNAESGTGKKAVNTFSQNLKKIKAIGMKSFQSQRLFNK